MNIAQAKRHVKDTIEAYLACDEDGLPLIDSENQRPLFLIGAPGIGKTAIMAQVASELGVGLVSYSMTHHTRQSALGLPFIVHHNHEGFEYEASEYTMSEIVASIYDYIEATGLSQGILFLDEINCVSETLYPSMLQFLQFKTFGRHRVPDGWVVACAGNPPEYNKSVHEFDIVIMDRLRKIEIEPELDVWLDYARDHDVHPSVLTFLESKQDCFYRVESTPTGKTFVTARGWDDLSRAIKAFEALEKPVDLDLVGQFVQNEEIAEAFALYYDLFKKYRSDYQVAAICAGTAPESITERARAAAFDERLALLGLILDALGNEAAQVLLSDEVLTRVRDVLRAAKPQLMAGAEAQPVLQASIDELAKGIERAKSAKTAKVADLRAMTKALDLLKALQSSCALAATHAGEPAFETIHQQFRGQVASFEQQVKTLSDHLENVFAFMEDAFANEREMLVFVTELSAKQATARFIGKYGCESYYRYNNELLVDENQRELFDRIDQMYEQRKQADEVAGEQKGTATKDMRADDDAAAAYYAQANFEFGYASLCHMALPAGLAGKAVLDIGCRRGKGVFKVSERVGESGHVIGIDWTPEHIEEATARSERAARESGLSHNNMEFYLAYPEDLSAVGLGNATLDLAFINSALHLTYKPDEVVREMSRVLKSGGEAIFEVALACGERDEQVVEAARELGNSIQAAPFKDAFVQQLSDAGFATVEFEEEKEISPSTGYKFDHEVATAPGEAGMKFISTVVHAYKG